MKRVLLPFVALVLLTASAPTVRADVGVVDFTSIYLLVVLLSWLINLAAAVIVLHTFKVLIRKNILKLAIVMAAVTMTGVVVNIIFLPVVISISQLGRNFIAFFVSWAIPAGVAETIVLTYLLRRFKILTNKYAFYAAAAAIVLGIFFGLPLTYLMW